MADTKHQQLVNSIANGVIASIKPLIESQKTESSAEFANILTILGSIQARLDVIGTEGGAKRAPRGERKTGAAAPAAPGSKEKSTEDKVANAMLYARWAMANDPDFRKRYRDAGAIAVIQADEKTMKLAEGSTERYHAEGSLLWRQYFTEAKKKAVKDEFGRWKETRSKNALEAPLDADVDIPQDDDL